MSNKEFWEEEPDLFWAYRFSYYKKIEREGNLYDHIAWLNGAYVYDAVSAAINNSFSKSKIDYPKKPYSELEKKEDSIENEVINIQNRIAEVQALFKQKEKTERKEE